jgi:hypothetical protein
MSNDVSVGHVLIAEYESLKKEQNSRIAFRDHLLYATLGSLAGTIAITIGAPARAPLLLVLPAVCVVLGWTYLVNDEKVSALGRYVREQLAPKMAELAQDDSVFGWERIHRADDRRVSRKALQLGVELTTFVLPAVAAVVTYWLLDPYHVVFTVIAAVEMLVTAVLARQMFLYADLSRMVP